MGVKRILFVCLGNICRSPAAEGVFLHKLEEWGLSKEFEVDSAGTGGYHIGEPADARMREAALKRGYHLPSRARKFVRGDFDKFDLIIAMDRTNMEDILALDTLNQHGDQVKLFSAFVPGNKPVDVPDPYYRGLDGFELVLDLIESGCEPLRDYLQHL